MNENRFVSWVRRHPFWSTVIALLLFVVGIPVLINLCYSCDHVLYVTKWGAEDVLAYYGSILGAFVTLAGLAVTIMITRKQIQRESFLNRENEKWKTIESEIADVLDRINPWRIFMVGRDGLTESGTNYSFIITSSQKYQMDCRIATDKLSTLLSPEDYCRIEMLFQQIQKNADALYDICSEQCMIYEKMRDLENKDIMLRMLEIEREMPDSFSEEELERCRTILENASQNNMNCLQEATEMVCRKLADSYTGSYRPLLALKEETFEIINDEIQERADAILRFGRKKECQPSNGSEKTK